MEIKLIVHRNYVILKNVSLFKIEIICVRILLISKPFIFTPVKMIFVFKTIKTLFLINV
jgi:hypothetical protein